MRVDHFRQRKTGPCFALAVLVCAVHRLGFTLYPPGHVPYGRIAVAPLNHDGEVLLDGPEAERDASVAWKSTVFGASMDAASGVAWPRINVAADPRRWWRTQGRYVDLGARLVAVAGAVSQRQRERVARTLGIALLVLLDAAQGYARGGYRGRGQAVLQVLKELVASATIGDRLIASGAVMKLWGRPSRWDPGGQAFRPTLRALLRPDGA